MKFVVVVVALLMTEAKAETGIASVYSTRDSMQNGTTTACGPKLKDHALTAAHKTLPCGARVRVTYKGKSIVVIITDRGPFIRGRIIDLTLAGAKALGFSGLAKVTIQRLDF